MIAFVITHEQDDRRPGGWFVVTCPEHGRLVAFGDGAVRRSTREDALRAARIALLEHAIAGVRAGLPFGFAGFVVVDQTAFAPVASAGGAP